MATCPGVERDRRRVDEAESEPERAEIDCSADREQVADRLHPGFAAVKVPGSRARIRESRLCECLGVGQYSSVSPAVATPSSETGSRVRGRLPSRLRHYDPSSRSESENGFSPARDGFLVLNPTEYAPVEAGVGNAGSRRILTAHRTRTADGESEQSRSDDHAAPVRRRTLERSFSSVLGRTVPGVNR